MQLIPPCCRTRRAPSAIPQGQHFAGIVVRSPESPRRRLQVPQRLRVMVAPRPACRHLFLGFGAKLT